jgi:hypothetical protein
MPVIPMNKCNYSPQISPVTIIGLTPPPATGPTLTRRATVLLQYPYASPTTTLEIRAPNTNNKLVPKISRVQAMSRGNELLVYRDPIWPKSTLINWGFEGLTKAEAEACLAFALLTCGQIVKVTDYESRVMRGILINPRNPISQESKEIIPVNPLSLTPREARGTRGWTWKCDLQGSFV